MKAGSQESTQTMQRVKVGMTGLAVVLLLIGLASVVFNAANRNTPGAGALANSEIASNAALGNRADANEPLTELGVSPSTPADQAAAKHPTSGR